MRLKKAYESMLVFENERVKEREARKELQNEVEITKMREMALNYQKAQSIREKEVEVKQAKFFLNEL